ncbi:MAG: alpha-amylase, partial [Pseudarthrobacter sp.]|nr:alpha-amylase [Pseudarthrobacter sp.]
TGPGGDQDARQTLFASQVPEYLDDDLLGTNATHATDNFNTSHPLYAKISQLAALTKEHPALRDGAHQHRYAADDAGVYAFSRTDVEDQREYVVALNNSDQPQTAEVPTYIAKRNYTRIYGDAAQDVKTAADGKLTVTVPPLSAVVYKSSGRIPHSKEAPAVVLQEPAAAPADNGRIKVTADVGGTSFYEVTFEAKTAEGGWIPIGTDDTAPYQVFHDVAALEAGTGLEYRATVLDNGGHTATSRPRTAVVPAPVLTMQKPLEGSNVEGSVELTATADPEKASHVVSFERSVDGAEWTAVGTDESSPVYSALDDVAALDLADGTRIQYRATMAGTGFSTTSEPRTVIVGPAPQPDSVTVAGSFNSEMGCPKDWDETCAEAAMTLDPADRIWRLTVNLSPGQYEYKAVLNQSWNSSYGAGGALGGSNIVLDHPGGYVTFRYDNRTHLVTAHYASEQPAAVSVPGSMNSEMGCLSDWDPACDQAQLTLDPADLVWKLTVDSVDGGSYAFKAALNRTWDLSYGVGGASPGADIPFAHDGGPVTFRYDHATHLVSVG